MEDWTATWARSVLKTRRLFMLLVFGSAAALGGYEACVSAEAKRWRSALVAVPMAAAFVMVWQRRF